MSCGSISERFLTQIRLGSLHEEGTLKLRSEMELALSRQSQDDAIGGVKSIPGRKDNV